MAIVVNDHPKQGDILPLRTSEVLIASNTEDKPTGYSLLLLFPNHEKQVEGDTLILEAQFLPDERCRFKVRVNSKGELYYKCDHYMTARELCIALNIIEHHREAIVKALVK